jgi:hypothetical protein
MSHAASGPRRVERESAIRAGVRNASNAVGDMADASWAGAPRSVPTPDSPNSIATVC